MTKENAPKMPKKKGPIRLEAIVPITIIVVLTGLYFSFFFDSHMRKAIEWTASYVHGAEVNVGSLRTSVLGGSLSLKGLQVTDKKDPSRNLVQIGEIRFGLLWDALLRAKFVINEASIENIQAYAPRKSPGYVTPPSKESAVKKVEDTVLDQTKEEYTDNMLGDVAEIIGGTKADDQLKSIQGNLKAEAQIKELQKSIKEKEAAWQKRLKELPQKKELDALVARAKAVNLGGNDPLKIANGIKELDKIIKEGDKIVKYYDKANKELNSDLKFLDKEYSSIDDMVKKDIKDLQKRFKIPSLDPQDFAKGLFGRMFSDKLATLNKYKSLARQYMPPSKGDEKKEPELVPHKRGEGKDYKFPVTKGYPLFWLKKAIISSEPTDSEYSGKVRGEINHVTTNPPLIGVPMLVKIQGDFPKMQIMGLDTKITVDHTTNKPKETLELKVNAYPVGEQIISNSDDVKFIMKSSKGQVDLKAVLADQKLMVNLINYFKEIDYNVTAKSKLVNEVLKGVAKDIPVVDIKSKATGTWSGLKWNISSNLGDAIARGFKKQLDAQIKKAQAEIKKMVDDRISAEKKKVQAEMDRVKKQVTGEIEKQKKEIDKAKKVAQSQMNDQKKKQSKSLEKAGKDLLKKIKF